MAPSQFFATTHSPLVARSFQSISGDQLNRHYHLRSSEGDNGVQATLVPSLSGRRTDQILATEAFDYLIDDDPDTEHILQELSFLAGNEFLTDEQRERLEVYLELVSRIQSIRMGQTRPSKAPLNWPN